MRTLEGEVAGRLGRVSGCCAAGEGFTVTSIRDVTTIPPQCCRPRKSAGASDLFAAAGDQPALFSADAERSAPPGLQRHHRVWHG